MLKLIAAAGIVLGSAAAAGCGGESEGPYPLAGDTGTDGGSDGGADACGNKCGTNTHCNTVTGKCEQGSPDACENTCGTGTHCNETTKKCDPDTGVDACGNACGTNTFCNDQTGKCEPVTGKFAGVTWQNFNAGSGNGWVDQLYGTDGNYPLGKTAWFTKGETPAAVCFVAYGSGSILTMNGSGEWWDVEKPWLAAQTGHSLSDGAYFTSQQAAKDAAGELLSYRTTPVAYRPGGAFVWRAAGKDQSWQDHDPVTNSQSAIHCAHVPNNGVVEKY